MNKTKAVQEGRLVWHVRKFRMPVIVLNSKQAKIDGWQLFFLVAAYVSLFADPYEFGITRDKAPGNKYGVRLIRVRQRPK